MFYSIKLQELFKSLIPHQCLGATWSRRDKNEANTVVATVTQFNAVSFRVISSILIEPKLRPQVSACEFTILFLHFFFYFIVI